MNGKITDIGWYKPIDSTTYKNKGLLRDSLLPISYKGKSDKYNQLHTQPKKYLEESMRQPDAMTSLNYLLNLYSLKGFEFGNWTTQEERLGFVNDITTTLAEMANLMGSKNIGFDHNIGIAFGARGNRGALAHYESVLNMINLTRKKGMGSLAHEYGHALDYNFGAFVDQNQYYTALSGGHSTVAVMSPEVLLQRANTGGQLRALTNAIVDSIKQSESFAKLLSFKKGNLSSEYWRRRTEVFARFFEQYICYLYKQEGKTNRILTKPWSVYIQDAQRYGIYLNEKDFDKVKPLADKLLKEMAAFLNDRKTAVLRPTKYPKPEIHDNEIPISYKQYLIIRNAIATAAKFKGSNSSVFFVPFDPAHKSKTNIAIYVAYGRTANLLSQDWLNRGNGLAYLVNYVYKPAKTAKASAAVSIPAFYCDEVQLHEMCIKNKEAIVLYDGNKFLDQWDGRVKVADKITKKQSAKETGVRPVYTKESLLRVNAYGQSIDGLECVPAKDLEKTTKIPAKAWRDLFQITDSYRKNANARTAFTGIYVDEGGYIVATDAASLAFAACPKNKYIHKLVYPDGVKKNENDKTFDIGSYARRIYKYNIDHMSFTRWANIQPSERDCKYIETCSIASVIDKVKKEAKGAKIQISDKIKRHYIREMILSVLRFLANFDDQVSMYDAGSNHMLVLSTKNAQGLVMPIVEPI